MPSNRQGRFMSLAETVLIGGVFARFLHATGFGPDDIVQNCFSYHLTPAGTMFENGARAVGAAVLPAGTGQTELQAQAAHDVGVTGYAGTPDYLKVILEKADEMGLTLGIGQSRSWGRSAVSLVAAMVCRPGHHLPPMLCDRGSWQCRL
jgi:hypothetical protein